MPDDVLRIIFSHLDSGSIARTKRGCKKFHRILNEIDFKKRSVLSTFRMNRAQCEVRIPKVFEAVGGYKPDLKVWDEENQIANLTDETLPLFINRMAESKRDYKATRVKNIYIPLTAAGCTVLCCAVLAFVIWGIVRIVHQKK